MNRITLNIPSAVAINAPTAYDGWFELKQRNSSYRARLLGVGVERDLIVLALLETERGALFGKFGWRRMRSMHG